MPGRRRYGFFRCEGCNARWESSHVYEKAYGSETYYEQDCKKCNTSWAPYRTEAIKCSLCGLEDCVCSREDKKKRHVDPNKPHLSHLCAKCRAGHRCQQAPRRF